MVGRLAEYCEKEDFDAYLLVVESWSRELWNAIQKVLKRREILVIHCKNMTQKEKAEFMDSFARSVGEYSNFIVIVDEIHEIVPERGGVRALDFDRLIRMGANQQIGFIFTTQRPQIVSKDILALADIHVFFRVVYGGDLAVLRELLKYHLKSSEEIENTLREIQGLKTGQYRFFAFVSDKTD